MTSGLPCWNSRRTLRIKPRGLFVLVHVPGTLVGIAGDVGNFV